MNRREFFALVLTAAFGAIGRRADKLPPVTVPAPIPQDWPQHVYVHQHAITDPGHQHVLLPEQMRLPPNYQVNPPIQFGNNLYWSTVGTRQLETTPAAIVTAACCL